MPRNSAQFIQDFLFTDSNNHTEFLKCIQTLDKDDHLLLIHLLERLNPNNDTFHEEIAPFNPCHDNHLCRQNKNPLNIAKCHVALMALAKHEFNIFEVAYLDSTSTTFWTAFAALFSQWLLLLILLLYHTIQEKSAPTAGDNRDSRAEFALVFLVCTVTTFLFSKRCLRRWHKCVRFIDLVSDTAQPAPITLWMNRLASQILSILVVFFNIYFTLISPNPSEAIVSALVLYFVLEIDNEVVPDWDDDDADDAKAGAFRDYFQRPLKAKSLYTTISYHDMGISNNNSHEIGRRHGPRVFADKDRVYVDVVWREKKVTVWIGLVDPISNLTTGYKGVDYYVNGESRIVKRFLDAVGQFKCIRAFKDRTGMSSRSDSGSRRKFHDPKRHVDEKAPSSSQYTRLPRGSPTSQDFREDPFKHPDGPRGQASAHHAVVDDIEQAPRLPKSSPTTPSPYGMETNEGAVASRRFNDGGQQQQQTTISLLGVINEEPPPLRQLTRRNSTKGSLMEDMDVQIAFERLGTRKWKATMVREIVICAKCQKPRCIFSKDPLDKRSKHFLRQRIEMTRFVCGTSLFDESERVGKLLAQRRTLSCDSPIEKAYYNPRKGRSKFITPDLCSHCGNGNDLLDTEDLRKQGEVQDDSERYPICRECLSCGKVPIKLPRVKKKDKDSLEFEDMENSKGELVLEIT